MEGLDQSGLDAITSSDAVVLVMGITGSGKSTFISELVEEDVQVGHDLTSCTSGVNFFALEYQQGRRIFLIDTPGFDDTYRSNSEVLKDIAFILAQLYRMKIALAGVIYLHRITDNRLSGTAVTSLKILAKLCGEGAYRQIILTTSMWDTVRVPGNNAEFLSAIDRENQLKQAETAWRGLCSRGSPSMRWIRSKEGWSSIAILDALMDLYLQYGQLELRIQVELVDEGKHLDDTEARMAVDEELSKAQTELREEMEALKARYREAMAKRNSDVTEEISLQLDASMKRAERLESSHREIKVGMARLAHEMHGNYQTMLTSLLEEQAKAKEVITGYQTHYHRLMDQERINVEVIEQSQRQYDLERRYRSESEVASLDGEKQELEDQFQEEQQLSEKERAELDKKVRRAKRKKLMKANIIPILQILAGLGATVGGGVIMNPAIMAPGIGAMVSGISQLKFSTRNLKKSDGADDSKGFGDVDSGVDGDLG